MEVIHKTISCRRLVHVTIELENDVWISGCYASPNFLFATRNPKVFFPQTLASYCFVISHHGVNKGLTNLSDFRAEDLLNSDHRPILISWNEVAPRKTTRTTLIRTLNLTQIQTTHFGPNECYWPYRNHCRLRAGSGHFDYRNIQCTQHSLVRKIKVSTSQTDDFSQEIIDVIKFLNRDVRLSH